MKTCITAIIFLCLAAATAFGEAAEGGENPVLNASVLAGARVYDAQGAFFAKVSDLVLTEKGRVDAAIIHSRRYWGLGAHEVAIPLEDLRLVRTGSGKADIAVQIRMTKAAFFSLPAFHPIGLKGR